MEELLTLLPSLDKLDFVEISTGEITTLCRFYRIVENLGVETPQDEVYRRNGAGKLALVGDCLKDLKGTIGEVKKDGLVRAMRGVSSV